MMTVHQRIEKIRAILEEHYDGEEHAESMDFRTPAVDLLADLLHYARHENLDIDDMMLTAEDHTSEEFLEELET